MMPQGEGEPGVEDDAPPDARLGGQAPQFVHYGRSIARIVKERPRRMLAKGLNEGDGVGWGGRVVHDNGIAEQDIKLD